MSQLFKIGFLTADYGRPGEANPPPSILWYYANLVTVPSVSDAPAARETHEQLCITLLEKALEHNSVVFKALVADTFLLLKGPFYTTFFACELFVLFSFRDWTRTGTHHTELVREWVSSEGKLVEAEFFARTLSHFKVCSFLVAFPLPHSERVAWPLCVPCVMLLAPDTSFLHSGEGVDGGVQPAVATAECCGWQTASISLWRGASLLGIPALLAQNHRNLQKHSTLGGKLLQKKTYTKQKQLNTTHHFSHFFQPICELGTKCLTRLNTYPVFQSGELIKTVLSIASILIQDTNE